MKNLLATIFAIMLVHLGFAANITAVQNGSWISAATWDLNRVPVDGDNITIPSGRTVMFMNTPYPQNNPPARPTLHIRIYGTLDFSSPGNDKLYLDAGSKIQIYPGGKIQTSSFSTEIIAIYNGLLDNTVWTGFPSPINGPASATATTLGFTNSLLPVKLTSFTIKREDKDHAKLTWITSSEVNSAYFEIETTNNNQRTWQPVTKIEAAHTSTATIEYNHNVILHDGENQFRLKQVDIDGKYTYSPVVKINKSEDVEIRVYYDNRSNTLAIDNRTSGTLEVALYNLSGNLILHRKGVGSLVSLGKTVPGVYILKLKSTQSQYAQKLFIR